MTKRYYLLKRTFSYYNFIISMKNLYDQATYFDMNQYEKIRKLTACQAEHNTTGRLLVYDYIENHFRLISSSFE